MNTILKYSSILFAMLMTFSFANAQDNTDDQLKKNINKVSGGIEKIKALEPISFQYNNNNDKELSKHLPSGERFSFSETSVSASFPSLIKTNSYLVPSGKNANKVTKVNEIEKEELIPVLVAAIKEQQDQIEVLKQEIEALKNQQQKTD
jgi:hypothetical protein